MKKFLGPLLWFAVALLGAWAYLTLALHRGERINSAFILVAALCTYAIGYRFYSKWIAARVLTLNDRRATPCEVHDDGKDFCKTNKWIVFGHHFAAISGPGPLVGPVLAAQFGYLPGTLWILIGVVLGGAVQDMVILVSSMRRDGKSLGQMVKEELNTTAGHIALVAILAIMVILLAVLALVVVKALAESPWGVFTVAATIPIAMFMGGYLRFWRVGKVMEASAFGVVLLLLAVWGGQYAYANPALGKWFTFGEVPLAWGMIGYGLMASVLPIWLLLAPRDYLSTFMKLGTIAALAAGLLVVLPELRMPALNASAIAGKGLVFGGSVFPFCFITIACGAISGFHTLIASGTTPKIITRESHARPIGYGAMCLESLVAIMALIAACTLDPSVYFGMNVSGTGPDVAAKAASAVATINNAGYVLTVDQMNQLAATMGEHTLFGKTAGAATLAVGMANIFSKFTHGRWLDLWYHFAIMFEALFILTTLDAGTRVGRYILQDFLGNIYKPLGDTRKLGPNILASALIVCGWGWFLIQGVRDPLGGINSLWPLFGIANQMLAAIALCLGTTIILKTALGAQSSSSARISNKEHAKLELSAPKPWLALLTLIPLIWLVSVTFTAGVQKIWHSDPRIGFLAQAKLLDQKINSPGTTAQSVDPKWLAEKKAMSATWATQRWNNLLDAVVAGTFLTLVSVVLLLSLYEWWLLLSRRKPAVLHESEPVWLPDYAMKESGANLRSAAGTAALALGMAKELSGEAHIERAKQAEIACVCEHHQNEAAPKTDEQRYVEMTERRFNGVTRCC